MKNRLLSHLVLALALSAGVAAAKAPAPVAVNDSSLTSKVGHEIRMYSRYTIWDNIQYRVVNGNVDLMGQVSQPYKKSDLQKIVGGIPGVNSVTNDLEVLPLSNMDDRLRLQVARSIYRDGVLSRYGMGALPSIHIIVDNGHVTLEGVVANEMDKNIAGIRASGAGLSFGQVVNNLRVENPPNKHS
jgi:hyperosmotically inducible protein